jgi:hypothetical protein
MVMPYFLTAVLRSLSDADPQNADLYTFDSFFSVLQEFIFHGHRSQNWSPGQRCPQYLSRSVIGACSFGLGSSSQSEVSIVESHSPWLG